MSIRRIIFWQPFASPHQEAFLEAVAEHFSGDVILGVERSNLPLERLAQGWREPKHVRVRVIDISKPENHSVLAGHRSAETLHVFTGFFSHPLVWAGFRKLASSQAGLAIYSEAPEQPFLTGWIKRLRGRLLAARWSKRFAFVLAVGGVGCAFFERIGFSREKIVPFGYYLSAPAATPAHRDKGEPFRFVFAGQLIRRKGVDLLIEACRSLPREGWQLDIYGAGPERPSLEKLTARLRLAHRITFHGMVQNDAMESLLKQADCAVLPSRFDGWGMLVNESLAAGVPVICTSQCGAASLPVECGIAAEYPVPGSFALASAIARALSVGPAPASVRLFLSAAIRHRGSAESGAARFLAAAMFKANDCLPNIAEKPYLWTRALFL